MSNPRNINQVLQGAVATAPAKLPAIPKCTSADKITADAVNALKERAEVREGARGNPFERAALLRDLDELGLVRTGPAPCRPGDLAGIIGQTKAGEFVLVSLDDLVKAINEKISASTGGNFA